MGMKRWTPFAFWRWTLLFLLSYGVGHVVLVALLGLALGLRARSLLLPYLLLLWCGFVGASLIYWARQSYERPKSGATRFALAMFLFLNLYLGALLFSTVKLTILSAGTALNDYAPYILLTSALSSAVVYMMARRRLESVSQSGTEGDLKRNL
jgi:hypothetical protein